MRKRYPSSVPVSDRFGSHVEVLQQRMSDLGRGIEFRDGSSHVLEPAVALGSADREREVTHTEPRVPPFGAVGGRPAPVLGKEEREPPASWPQIVWVRVEAHELRIARDSLIEAIDERLEEGHAAYGFIERDVVGHLSSDLQHLNLGPREVSGRLTPRTRGTILPE